jgi:hypothetical protein
MVALRAQCEVDFLGEIFEVAAFPFPGRNEGRAKARSGERHAFFAAATTIAIAYLGE